MEKKSSLAGIIAIALSSLCFIANFLLFLPILCEKIKTGFGFGTRIEMLGLTVWSVNILTVPFILVSVILAIISAVEKDAKWKTVLSFSLIAFTIVEIFLSTLFMFI